MMLFLEPIPGVVCAFPFRFYNDLYVTYSFPILLHSLFLTRSHTPNHSMTKGYECERDGVGEDPEHS